jgi:hypothetical protein
MKARIVFSHEDYSSEAVKRKISYLILLKLTDFFGGMRGRT